MWRDAFKPLLRPLIRHRNQRNLAIEARPYFAAKEALTRPRSCIFFTTHKCASSFATQMLGPLSICVGCCSVGM